jgi:hypothetical protein
VADCRGFEAGVLKVRLGYFNEYPFEQVVPVGASNGFSTGAVDRGQPNRFFPGLNRSAFEISLSDLSQPLEWNINNRKLAIDGAIEACAGKCATASVGEIKEDLDRVAIELSQLLNKAAQALVSARRAKEGVIRGQVSDERDALRAGKRAVEYERAARSITIRMPSIVRTCLEAPKMCSTVDRQSAIDTLRGIYANQRNLIVRITARADFIASGKTTRRRSLVSQAKKLEQTGVAQLAKLPRFVTDCK